MVDAVRSRGRAIASAVLLVATAVSIALRLNSPAFLLPRLTFDDALWTDQAGYLLDGRYLGTYHFLTLAKGPGYSFFVAAVYESHLPLKLTEHGIRLVAIGVLAIAVARISRSRWLGVAIYVALALDPSYLGVAGSRVARDTLYGTLSLLLVATTLLLVDLVPPVMRRNRLLALLLAVGGGLAIGTIAAGYYLTREERIWLAPAVLAAGAVAIATWRRSGQQWAPLLGVVALMAVVAGSTAWYSVDAVRDRNEAAYGTRIIGALSEGGIVRAYAQWQRIDLGTPQQYIPVNTEQRHAAYAVSPAAAELAPTLEGNGTRWINRPECTPPLPDGCEYHGVFIWVIMEAAWAAGHEGDGAEANAFYDRLADEIAVACDDGRVPCVDKGPASLPPLERIDKSDFWPSLHITTTYMLSFDYAEPGAPRVVDSTDEFWRNMIRPLRGIDGTRSEYSDVAQKAAGRQQVVAGLADLYRWGARTGIVPALAGLVLALTTHTGRRHWRAALLGGVLLIAVASRIVVLALVDATTFGANPGRDCFDASCERLYGIYQLPATAFLVGLLVIGWWLLVTVVTDLRRERAVTSDPAPPAEAADPVEDEPSGAVEHDAVSTP
jgi:hypothetical protein